MPKFERTKTTIETVPSRVLRFPYSFIYFCCSKLQTNIKKSQTNIVRIKLKVRSFQLPLYLKLSFVNVIWHWISTYTDVIHLSQETAQVQNIKQNKTTIMPQIFMTDFIPTLLNSLLKYFKTTRRNEVKDILKKNWAEKMPWLTLKPLEYLNSHWSESILVSGRIFSVWITPRWNYFFAIVL